MIYCDGKYSGAQYAALLHSTLSSLPEWQRHRGTAPPFQSQIKVIML